MPPPVVGSFAQRVLTALSPVNYEDALHNYSFSTFIGALGDCLFQDVEDLAADRDDAPGWSVVLDVDDAPDYALPWLAQVVGVQLVEGSSAASQRQQMKDLANWKRGSLGSIQKAPLPFLTGTKTVIVTERDVGVSPTDASAGLRVRTLTAETPDTAPVLAALMSQKPAGIILLYETYSGLDYQGIFSAYATYQALFAAFNTYGGIYTNRPGT